MKNGTSLEEHEKSRFRKAISKIKKIIKNKENYDMKKVCFYYGTPCGINGINDIEEVKKLYLNYDIVVFGDEYQLDTNKDYENTVMLIDSLRKSNNSIEIFGYVPCAFENGGKNLNTDEIKKLIKSWKDINATGIFYDEFGYDYGNTRKRQNELISYGKSLGLNAFVNSWRDEYVFSSESLVLDWMDKFEPNKNKIEPLLDKDDYALYENNFWSVKDNCQLGSRPENFYRAYKYFNESKDEYEMSYYKKFGTKIISLDGIYSKSDFKKKDELRSFSVLCSILLNIDGVAFGNEDWGALGSFEEFDLPEIELLNVLKKHDVKCTYKDYPREYKCTLGKDRINLTLDINPKHDTLEKEGIRKIEINGKEILNCYNS